MNGALWLAFLAVAQARSVPPDLRSLQADAVKSGRSALAHWGSNPREYAQWTTHSNRLVPAYVFGAAPDADLANYTGARSAYRRPQRLQELYGRVPPGTVNPTADYCDQTDLARLQRDALRAGKKHIVLIVFDGMGWEATRAAALHAGGALYREGKGNGLFFQDYAGGSPRFGLCCTSAYTDRPALAGLDDQTVRGVPPRGGYDFRKAGAAPWAPMADPEYIKGKRAGDHTVTDSAASATSLCAGAKTFNYSINVDPAGRQLSTVAHEAQAAGYAVGAVTSVPFSHATPAAAYAHNVSRADYQDLARDLLGLPSISHPVDPLPGMDVVIGAGWGVDGRKNSEGKPSDQGRNYVPGNAYLTAADRVAIDCEHGGKYLVAERRRGVAGAEALRAAAARAKTERLRLFGFFGVGGGGHLPFAGSKGDFRPAPSRDGKAESYSPADILENPQLADVAAAALDALSRRPRFWLMVEAGDVDWAMHQDNLDAMVGAIRSGDRAVRTVVEWVERHSSWQDALVIVTADHDHYFTLDRPEALAQRQFRQP